MKAPGERANMKGLEPQILSDSRPFTLPKFGKTVDEYEDAHGQDAQAGIYAIADGASDSAFARTWAELLVKRLLAGPPSENSPAAWRDWIAPAQEEWKRAVHSVPMPWYVESKIREGAFATCVSLMLRRGDTPDAPGEWSAWALGDSCLFHVRGAYQGTAVSGGEADGGFPLNDPEHFNNYPVALSSIPHANERVWSRVATTQGTWEPGDAFILATDALSEWLLREIVPTQDWARVLDLMDAPADNSSFIDLMSAEMNDGRLRNDDMTLLIVRLYGPAGEEGDEANVAPAG